MMNLNPDPTSIGVNWNQTVWLYVCKVSLEELDLVLLESSKRKVAYMTSSTKTHLKRLKGKKDHWNTQKYSPYDQVNS